MTSTSEHMEYGKEQYITPLCNMAAISTEVRCSK